MARECAPYHFLRVLRDLRVSVVNLFVSVGRAIAFASLLLPIVLAGCGSDQWSGSNDRCFTASRTYAVRTVTTSDGNSEPPAGWSVHAKTFPACVALAEKADRGLHSKYPDARYALIPQATFGCHKAC